MCVCVRICMHAGMHVCMYGCMDVCMDACRHAYMNVCTRAYVPSLDICNIRYHNVSTYYMSRC